MKLSTRVLFAGLSCALLLAAPAFAAGTLYVTLVGPGEATITLTAPDGTAVTQKTATGQALLSPKTAGSYKLKVELGGRSAEASVELPTSGQVQAVFNPDAQPMITVYVSAVEQVTVTSQRIEESLQSVPLAVTAIGSRQMETGLLQNIQQAAYITPNLYMETNTGIPSGSRAAIRGVGEDESFFSADTPVGIYVDDIYIPRQTGAQFDLYDLERIEVLRGPQGTLYGHVARANPHWRCLDGATRALAVFSGPHAYVSPRWYEREGVPTWNYVAVHAEGAPRLLEDPAAVRELLARLTDTHDGPGGFAALPQDLVARMAHGIVAFELPIERLTGKAKLSQNKTAGDRAGVIRGLEGQGDSQALEIAALLRAQEARA